MAGVRLAGELCARAGSGGGLPVGRKRAARGFRSSTHTAAAALDADGRANQYIQANPVAGALVRIDHWKVPPSPFVVRLVDAGLLPAVQGDVAFHLPWLAVEYVNGGVEGTTLEERVATSVRTLGHAFQPARAAHAIACLARGVEAIHSIDIVHRDITPWWENGAPRDESLRDAGGLTAGAIDACGRAWVGARGRICLRSTGDRATWSSVWQDSAWDEPIIALHAEVGQVVAVTPTGSIVGGRSLARIGLSQ